MLSVFWSSVTGGLATRWVALGGPAVVFWTGAVVAWTLSGGGWDRLVDVATALEAQSTPVQVTAILAGLLVVLASGIVVSRLTTPTLRWLEGYNWPKPAEQERQRRIKRIRNQQEADRAQFQSILNDQASARRALQDLYEKQETTSKRLQELPVKPETTRSTPQSQDPDATGQTEADRRELEEELRQSEQEQHRLEEQLLRLEEERLGLEEKLHRFPADLQKVMPTRTGNILRAAEARPAAKYGLDSVIVWPRLWLVMPESSREELTAARAALEKATAAVIWSLGFAVLVPLGLLLPATLTGWAWQVVLVSLGAAALGIAIAYAAIRWWIPAHAEVFGDLVETSYDLYRTSLYQQLRWPLPHNPQDEHNTGQQVTDYLWRGSDTPHPCFTNPD